MTHPLPNCPDCGAAPGSIHNPHCDVELCSSCGGQRLFCFCDGWHDSALARWTGFWPGECEAAFLGIDLNELIDRGLHRTLFVKPSRKRPAPAPADSSTLNTLPM